MAGEEASSRSTIAHISLWAGVLPVNRMDGRASAECRCGYWSGFLTRKILRNGSTQLRWQCERCDDFNSFSYIPHAFLDEFGVTVDDLPVCQDDRALWESVPCVVCGDVTSEWHHWAPRSIFGDLPEWRDVGAYLCLAHHREWHQIMRANGLRWPHELAAEAV